MAHGLDGALGYEPIVRLDDTEQCNRWDQERCLQQSVQFVLGSLGLHPYFTEDANRAASFSNSLHN
jgi:hypothetical protein